ncbi:MAG: hypothetical protein ABEH38_07905 [Flavobacteriales bacterium]
MGIFSPISGKIFRPILLAGSIIVHNIGSLLTDNHIIMNTPEHPPLFRLKGLLALFIFFLLVLTPFAINSQSGTSTPPFDKLPYSDYEADLQALGSGNLSSTNFPVPTSGQYPNVPAKYRYQGDKADHNLNAIYGPNQRLLFFINDKGIYDRNGLRLNKHGSQDLYVGGSEVIVFPLNKKGDCSKYAIISAKNYWTDIANAREWYEAAKIQILDLSKTSNPVNDLVPNQTINGRIVHEQELKLEGPNGIIDEPFDAKNVVEMAVTPRTISTQDGGKKRKLYIGTSQHIYQYSLDFSDGYQDFVSKFHGQPDKAFNIACASTIAYDDRGGRWRSLKDRMGHFL